MCKEVVQNCFQTNNRCCESKEVEKRYGPDWGAVLSNSSIISLGMLTKLDESFLNLSYKTFSRLEYNMILHIISKKFDFSQSNTNI